MDHSEAISDAAAGDTEDYLATGYDNRSLSEVLGCDDICDEDPEACFH